MHKHKTGESASVFRQTEPVTDAGAVIIEKKNMAFSV